MFVRISRTIYLEHNFSKGRVRIWFFGIDWFQIAAIVKWPMVTRLLGEPLSAGMTPAGVPYAWAWLGICTEGDHRYQPAEWLEWMQLQNNVVGVNGPGGARTDVVLW
jgi:hypothetical protein